VRSRAVWKRLLEKSFLYDGTTRGFVSLHLLNQLIFFSRCVEYIHYSSQQGAILSDI